MEKIFEQGLLYDFYGELLTDHQKKMYEAAVFNDLSLSEIAVEAGISRQGVHDLLKRCDRILQGYEEKLHLVERFQNAKKTMDEIWKLSDTAAQELQEKKGNEHLTGKLVKIGQLSRDLIEEL